MHQSPTIDELVGLLIPAWTEALGKPANNDSDFFALGGTSLAAVSIAETVATRYKRYDGIDLEALQTVFDSPTLTDMANALKTFIDNHPGDN